VTSTTNNESITVSSRSMSVKSEELIGVRDISFHSNGGQSKTICLEYQCSYLMDKRAKRNLIEIEAQVGERKCTRTSTSSEFSRLISSRKPIARQLNKSSYRMFAPFHRKKTSRVNGIFQETEQAALAAKKKALQTCSSSETTDVAAAIHFTCK